MLPAVPVGFAGAKDESQTYLKILHLNNEKTWRGGERQTLLLAAGLQARGVESVIGCRSGSLLENAARAARVTTVSIPANNFGAALELIRLANHFDLIHCHTGRGHSLAAFTSLVHGRPFIATRRVDFAPAKNFYNRYKFHRAARVVCISKFIADQLADWGVPRKQLPVVPSSVPLPDAELLSPQHRATVRGRLNIPPGLKLVGNIAALVGHKDHATMLRAARLVCDRQKDVQFVILGDGELRSQLLTQRGQLGLDSQVLMPGFVPKAEECLPAFDVFVMSSCMEGLGSIVLDAFAANVPVAATAGGGIPELVRNGRTGLLVPVGDAAALADSILQLLADDNLRAQLSSSASAWVQNECSVDKMTDAYLNLYSDILK